MSQKMKKHKNVILMEKLLKVHAIITRKFKKKMRKFKKSKDDSESPFLLF